MLENPNHLFVTCGQGLESLLIQELAELGFTQVREGFRGVYVFDKSFPAIFRLNYCSRIAGRVLLPLAQFPCYDQKGLYKGGSSIDWLKYLPSGKNFAIDANVSHRQLKNSLFAAQVLKDAICDQIRAKTGNRPSVNVKNPDVQLNLFIHDNQATISVDTSGTPLHKRGYRQESAEAPLQESLAAALLRLADYQPHEILLDPCCGGGTLLIEAALIASRTAPGYLRQKWGFMLLPHFSFEEWLKVKTEVDALRQAIPKNHLFGIDINKNVARICQGNLRAAGFLKDVLVKQADFREFSPSILPTMILTNPPHGKRLDNVDTLIPLYRALGDFMKHHVSKPARGFIFTANTPLVKEIGLSASRRHVITNSSVDSRLLEFDLY
ncbi:Ribosomal RNA large subunit methyltransferase K/L [Neochlamydia sp. TUME1]|uniref:THUMP domain-containing class I SAM-dependent RNA methyltransferase n=1 Tax=Neochlamydia sp. TUME1 TaxID=1478174 RepID=UPI00058273DB|nr:THUMP domain-containing protein [Neochlamydia sp. TUME1]KIC75873.1 Ribosomal RNA large subunit methyltransferase K/L [Neochlamydia sp. TUME1]